MLETLARSLTILLLSSALSATLQAADLTWTSNSVIKLFMTQQAWTVSEPWKKHRASQGTCTGFFIKQGILTNAHCVADATYIEIEIPGINDKLEVKTIAINHQIDLALLQLLQPEQRPDEVVAVRQGCFIY